MKHERQAFRFEFKAAENEAGEPVIEGYGSTFGNIDSYGDIVAAGAFTKSLDEHRTAGVLPAMLWQHNSDWPVGHWTEVAEDGVGLKVTGRPNLKTSRGLDAYEHVKAGDISGLSIGFRTKNYEFDEATAVRTLTEVELWEISLVTFPANDLARITDARSVEEIDAMSVTDIERALREAGFTAREARAICHRLKSEGAACEAAALADLKTTAALERLARAIRP